MSAYCLRSGFDYLTDLHIELVQNERNGCLKVGNHAKIVGHALGNTERIVNIVGKIKHNLVCVLLIPNNQF